MTNSNFITYCDSMMIANESFSDTVKKIKAWLIKQFKRILDWLERMVDKMKDTRFKVERNKWKIKLLSMIRRAKSGLSKSESLNEHNPELAKKLKEEVEILDAEIKEIDQNPVFRSVKNGTKKALGVYKDVQKEKNHKTWDININFNRNKKNET